MAKLNDLRQKYPQYNDMSDKEFADAFQKKYYSDMSPSDFYSKIGLSQPDQGWQSVLGDIGKSVASLPGAIGSSIANLPGQAYQGGKQALTNVPRTAENLGYGLLNGIQGATEIPANIAEYLKSKNVGPRGAEDFVINNTMRGNALTDALKKHLGPDQEGDEFLRGLGGFLPVSKIGAASEGLAGILKRAGAGGAYSASQNQDPIVGALTNMAMEAPGNLGSKIANADLSPTNIAAKVLRGKLSPEELSRNLEIARGTNTPLGRVIQEPLSNTLFETLTSRALGSGKMLGDISQQVKDRASDLLESLKPAGADGDLNNLTHKFLEDASEKQRVAKNALYKDREKIEQSDKHVLKLPNTEQFAKERADAIKNSPFYIEDPEFRNQYNRLLGYKQLTKEKPAVVSSFYDKNGNLTNPYGGEVLEPAKTISPSLTEAQVIASDWKKKGEKLDKIGGAKNQTLANNLIGLSGMIRKDVEESVAKGSPELQEAHAAANKNYAENYSPFLDESVRKKIQETEPQTMVRDIINPGKEADKYSDIEKVVNLLPDNQKNILAYAHLKRAQDKYGAVDAKKLAARIDSLGPRQLEKIIPDEGLRQKVENFGKLRGMNEKALNNMYNPETGIGAVPIAQVMWAAAHPVSAVPAFGAAYGLNKVLTSPSIREKLVNKMIQNSSKKEAPKASYLQNPTLLIQALMQAAKAKQPQKEEEK